MTVRAKIAVIAIALSLTACAGTTPAQVQSTQGTIQTAISAACGDVNAAAALAAPFSAIPQVASILTFAAASCAGANAVAALTTKALSDPTTVAWAENLATMLKTAVAAVKGL